MKSFSLKNIFLITLTVSRDALNISSPFTPKSNEFKKRNQHSIHTQHHLSIGVTAVTVTKLMHTLANT
jgi:hypothetical protein